MSGRFAKGHSGNPGGRPRKPVPAATSAFDIIIDRTLTVTQNGRERELTIDEALQQKTYQAAISGSRMAQREIMKMIDRREKAVVAKLPPRPSMIIKKEHGPVNADAALLLLDIVQTSDEPYPRNAISSWALQAALDRCRGELNEQDLDQCRRDAFAPVELRWPRPSRQ